MGRYLSFDKRAAEKLVEKKKRREAAEQQAREQQEEARRRVEEQIQALHALDAVKKAYKAGKEKPDPITLVHEAYMALCEHYDRVVKEEVKMLRSGGIYSELKDVPRGLAVMATLAVARKDGSMFRHNKTAKALMTRAFRPIRGNRHAERVLMALFDLEIMRHDVYVRMVARQILKHQSRESRALVVNYWREYGGVRRRQFRKGSK